MRCRRCRPAGAGGARRLIDGLFNISAKQQHLASRLHSAAGLMHAVQNGIEGLCRTHASHSDEESGRDGLSQWHR